MPEDKSTYKNQYVPLEDLVYAPLQAIALSNMKLSGSIIELINKSGDLSKGPDGETIVHLKTMNLAYEKLKNDELDMHQIEEIELKVPLMSLIPLPGLAVDNANLKFNVGINTVIKKNEKYLFEAQVSSPNERCSDNMPKISYDINLKNTPAPEGLSRLIDILDISQIPKTLKKKL